MNASDIVNATAKMMRCPDCGRRGVYVNRNAVADFYKCRYTHLGCDFYAYANGASPTDTANRQRLADANPGALDDHDVRGYYSYD